MRETALQCHFCTVTATTAPTPRSAFSKGCAHQTNLHDQPRLDPAATENSVLKAPHADLPGFEASVGRKAARSADIFGLPGRSFPAGRARGCGLTLSQIKSELIHDIAGCDRRILQTTRAARAGWRSPHSLWENRERAPTHSTDAARCRAACDEAANRIIRSLISPATAISPLPGGTFILRRTQFGTRWNALARHRVGTKSGTVRKGPLTRQSVETLVRN